MDIKVKVGDIVRITWEDATHDYANYFEEDLEHFGLATAIDIGEVVHINGNRIVLCNRKFPAKQTRKDNPNYVYVSNYKSLFAIPWDCITKVEKLKVAN